MPFNMLHFDVYCLLETSAGLQHSLVCSLGDLRIQKFGNFTLFNSRSKSKRHEFGCRFYVRGEFLKYVKDFKIINERICYLRLREKWFSCIVINVHAPTNEKMEEVKDDTIYYSKV